MNLEQIRTARPGDVIRDDKVKGLHLRCFEKGKYFYLYFRTKTGIERKPKLGDFPNITLEQARKIAKDLLFQVSMGKDPVAERTALREAPTLAQAWDRGYKEHFSTLKTAEEVKRSFEFDVPAKLLAKRVIDIEHEDVYNWHQGMKKKPIQANRVLATMATLLRLAEVWKMRPRGSNPCGDVSRFKENKRRRYMAGEEAAKLSEAMHFYKDKYPAAIAFLYLLILTGARKGEIAKAKWDQIKGNVLTLTEHKTDNHGQDRQIHLPGVAMEILEKLPKVKGGTITGLKNPNWAWIQVRKMAGCTDLHLHDLRHSFASTAISAGFTLAQIGELLGHKSTATTQRYAHLMEDAAQTAVNQISDRIGARMNFGLTPLLSEPETK